MAKPKKIVCDNTTTIVVDHVSHWIYVEPRGGGARARQAALQVFFVGGAKVSLTAGVATATRDALELSFEV